MTTFLGKKDNISTVLPKADYGIKISKAGFDALTCADNDLLFNSSWPSIQHVSVAPAVEGATVPHGLDFTPMAFVLGGTKSNTVMYGMDVDENNVYVHDLLGDTSATLVVYHVDITTDVEYPYTAKTSFNTTYNPDYGIKIVKSGGDIDSTDLRDYILHSRCGSPLILAVKTQETVNPANPTTVQYTSRLGYPTLNFGYSGVAAGTAVRGMSATFGNGGYKFAPQGGQTSLITRTDGYSAQIATGANGKASIVCLRSPIFATTNSVVVNY